MRYSSRPLIQPAEEARSRPPREVGLAASRLDRTSRRPLSWQIYDAVRTDVLEGHLAPGDRLPSTRSLAADLGLSRQTVVIAFELLAAEGYLVSKVGSGTTVSPDLPPELLATRQTREELGADGDDPALPSEPGDFTAFRFEPKPFQLGLPALDHVPWARWERAVSRAVRTLAGRPLEFGDPRGDEGLRREISRYLRSLRGLDCRPDQIFVVSGSQQGLDLAARVLLRSGERVWIEDPGYLGARAALLESGARLVPVPVDDQGLRVDEGEARCPNARAVYVTPSHQYPTGVTLSLGRRLRLLEWANDADAFVLEDDYDSEYRFAGHPLSPLAGLDDRGRVIYIGTFSKVFAPFLRIGYLVVPRSLVGDFARARYASDRQNPSLEQIALAELLETGELGRHVRRSRVLYRDRLAALETAVSRHLGDRAFVGKGAHGLHAVIHLRPGTDDRQVAQRARDRGVVVSPISQYRIEASGPPALVLGYAAFGSARIDAAIATLADILV